MFHEARDIADALAFGYPRLLVYREGERGSPVAGFYRRHSGLPVLSFSHSGPRVPGGPGNTVNFGPSAGDGSPLRLRRVLEDAAVPPAWVGEILNDLTQVVGRRLPPDLRGLARRVLEYPKRYTCLRAFGDTFGFTPGALKARFRRRGIPSPSRYLRWFRVFAAGHVLSDPEETVLSASFRLGFTSDGNFCRWVTAVCGLTPSALREWDRRLLLLIRMAEECLSEEVMEEWDGLEGLFLREVA